MNWLECFNHLLNSIAKRLHMDVSENRGSPQIIHFNRVFHYKPSILGYPYFWKHPYTSSWEKYIRRHTRPYRIPANFERMLIKNNDGFAQQKHHKGRYIADISMSCFGPDISPSSLPWRPRCNSQQNAQRRQRRPAVHHETTIRVVRNSAVKRKIRRSSRSSAITIYTLKQQKGRFWGMILHLQSFIQGPLYRGIVCSFLKKRCWHLDLVFSWQGFSSSFPGSLPKPQRCQIGWFVWHLDLPVCVSNGFVSGCHFTILLGFKDGTPWMVSG